MWRRTIKGGTGWLTQWPKNRKATKSKDCGRGESWFDPQIHQGFSPNFWQKLNFRRKRKGDIRDNISVWPKTMKNLKRGFFFKLKIICSPSFNSLTLWAPLQWKMCWWKKLKVFYRKSCEVEEDISVAGQPVVSSGSNATFWSPTSDRVRQINSPPPRFSSNCFH